MSKALNEPNRALSQHSLFQLNQLTLAMTPHTVLHTLVTLHTLDTLGIIT
ncbi:unannotated protein [freshwater metagenome]|uniref:Unannotated protein n=1 Tax=freshwater metagenome TaxID=449393 RepID=A0A6J5ZLD0_9ZZZZ